MSDSSSSDWLVKYCTLSFEMSASWERLGTKLDAKGIKYDKLILREKAQSIANFVVFRRVNPTEDGSTRTANSELVAMELNVDNLAHVDQFDKRSASDSIRRVLTALCDAALLEREMDGKEAYYTPTSLLTDHFEGNAKRLQEIF